MSSKLPKVLQTPSASDAPSDAPYVPATAEEALALQEPRTVHVAPVATAKEPGTLGQANQTAAARGVSPDALRLRELANHNRASAAQFPQAQHTLVGREGPRFSNLPKQTAASIAIKAAEDATLAKRRAERLASGVALKKRWVKIGVQPAVGGFVLHTEHWEGDVKLKETVQRNLSPLAVREKLALHMAALYSVF